MSEIIVSESKDNKISDNKAIEIMQAVGQEYQDRYRESAFFLLNRRYSENTLESYQRDLKLFAQIVWPGAPEEAGEALQKGSEAWSYVNAGHLHVFVERMLSDGYSVSSIDRAIACVKSYAKAAFRAGLIDIEAERDISIFEFIGSKDKFVSNINEKRGPEKSSKKREDGSRWKKKEAFMLSDDQIQQLLYMHELDTLEGVRDATLCRLLIEFGMRSSEASRLTRGDYNDHKREIRVYRPKVANEGAFQVSSKMHALIKRLTAMHNSEKILIGVRNEKVNTPYMSRSSVSARIKVLGKRLSPPAPKLSGHDIRAWRTTDLKKKGYDILDIQRIGGWADARMPDKYIALTDMSETPIGEDL